MNKNKLPNLNIWKNFLEEINGKLFQGIAMADMPSSFHWAGSCAIDFTQLGQQKCFGTK